MQPTRLSRLLILMQSLRRCAAAILRHARALSPTDARHEHAMAEHARIKSDLQTLRAQAARLLAALIPAA